MAFSSSSVLFLATLLVVCFIHVSSAGRHLSELVQDPASTLLEYHKGPLLSGKISIILIWYGKFKPSQRAVVSAFVQSLYPSPSSKPQSQIQLSVSKWWKTTEKYYHLTSNKKQSSSLQLTMGRQILDDKYSLDNYLTSQQIVALAANGDQKNAIHAVLTASDVTVDGFCSILSVSLSLMASQSLPCDGEGICMVCKAKPSDTETLTCKTRASGWHVSCLSSPPESVLNTLQRDCPDCSGDNDLIPAPTSTTSNDLIASIRAIEADSTLTEQEKAKKRHQLMSNGGKEGEAEDDEKKKNKRSEGNDVMDILDGSFSCSFCMRLPERPVTTPCGHNFCLKCFQKWIGQGKRTWSTVPQLRPAVFILPGLFKAAASATR